jgi:hypothetical protein
MSNKMTYHDACKLFFKYGNVGKSISDLLTTKPTSDQLEEACHAASRAGIDEETIIEAKTVIIKAGLK